MAKREAPYAVITFYDNGKKIGSHVERDPRRYDDLKTRNNELTMKGLNQVGDTETSIRGR